MCAAAHYRRGAVGPVELDTTGTITRMTCSSPSLYSRHASRVFAKEMTMEHTTSNLVDEQCIADCLRCYQSCMQTAMGHCLETGGRHVEPEHFRLMHSCAEMCRTAADAMLSRSPVHAQICAACVEACEACGDSCADIGDMDDCVLACRACAQSCRKMAMSVQRMQRGA